MATVSAPFGRETHAFLGYCAICRKPYDGRGEWHTVKGGAGKVDLWWLECGECHGKGEGDDR